MKLLILCLTLGALPGFSQKGVIPVPDLVPASHVPLAPIALYTHFDHPAPQGVFEALQDELENIMQPIGWNFEWRSLNGVRGNEVSVELAVLTFKGRCDVAGLTPRGDTNPGALGWTHVSDGEILPFTDIACDRIREDFVRCVHASQQRCMIVAGVTRAITQLLESVRIRGIDCGAAGSGCKFEVVVMRVLHDFSRQLCLGVTEQQACQCVRQRRTGE